MKEQKATAHIPCTFCQIVRPEPTATTEPYLEEGRYTVVLRNLFPYALWDGAPVVDHLMIVPKRHIEAVASMTPEEQNEWTSTALKYEADDYSVYARSAGNGAKSIVHQHTHLIKIGKRPKKLRTLRSLYRIATED